jgi:hypothetical protein
MKKLKKRKLTEEQLNTVVGGAGVQHYKVGVRKQVRFKTIQNSLHAWKNASREEQEAIIRGSV